MQELEQLKETEKQNLWADGDSAETIEHLKISEADLPADHPQPRQTSQTSQIQATSCCSSRWQRVALVIGGVWLAHALISSGILFTNWWALFLLFPAFKNFQALKEDRQHGIANQQTKRHLKGGILALTFTFMLATNSWELFWPVLLIGWGITQVLFHQWRNELSFA